MTFPRFLRRGTWQPGRTNAALFTVQIVTTFTMLSRGLDYMRGGQEPTAVLNELILSAPLDLWGFFFIAGSVTISIGLLWHKGRIIASGHMIGMAAYAAVAYAQFQAIGFEPGIRNPIGMTGGAIIQCALGLFIFSVLRRRSIERDICIMYEQKKFGG